MSDDSDLDHDAHVAMTCGLAAAFREGASVIRYGESTITRDGDGVTFRHPLVADQFVEFDPSRPALLAAAWRKFSLAVVAECDAAMADFAPFIPTGRIN